MVFLPCCHFIHTLHRHHMQNLEPTMWLCNVAGSCCPSCLSQRPSHRLWANIILPRLSSPPSCHQRHTPVTSAISSFQQRRQLPTLRFSHLATLFSSYFPFCFSLFLFHFVSPFPLHTFSGFNSFLFLILLPPKKESADCITFCGSRRITATEMVSFWPWRVCLHPPTPLYVLVTKMMVG